MGTQYTFHSSVDIPFTTVYLGHFAENHGEHYMSLIPNLNNNIDTSNGNDNYTEVVTSSITWVKWKMMRMTLMMTQIKLAMAPVKLMLFILFYLPIQPTLQKMKINGRDQRGKDYITL